MSYIGNSPAFDNLNVNKYLYIATEGQVSFSATYDTVVDVWLNGVKLQVDVDYTATDGVAIILSEGASAGDVIDIQGYFNMENFDIDNVLPTQTGNSGKFLTTDGSASSWSEVDLTPYAPLESPVLTGTPAAPTANTGTANTQIATTEFVSIQVAEYNVFNKSETQSSLFAKNDAASVTIPAGTYISVGYDIIRVTSPVTLSLNTNLDTGSKVAGTDYYVYALSTGGFILSANASYPSGYSASTSRKIGGFHYGVIPESFTAINNISSADATLIAGVNNYSLWDLKWRPVANPEGMHKVGNRWYDIYLLNSEHIVNGTSKAGATIAGGATDYGRAYPKIPLAYGGDGSSTYGSLTWFEASEIGNAYGKDLISYKEFEGLAYGVQEQASWGDSSATIQHVANHTSKWGTCQATGVEWIWGADINNGYGSTAFTWRTGLTESRGDIYATSNAPTAALLGGRWIDGSTSGSRCSSWRRYVWYSVWHIGCRFASDHLVLA